MPTIKPAETVTAQKKSVFTKRNALIAGIGVSLGMAAEPALAGTGGEALLKESFDQTIAVGTGYGAKLAAGVSGTFAMIGSILKFNPQLVGSAIGVGLLGSGIDNIASFTVTALI